MPEHESQSRLSGKACVAARFRNRIRLCPEAEISRVGSFKAGHGPDEGMSALRLADQKPMEIARFRKETLYCRPPERAGLDGWQVYVVSLSSSRLSSSDRGNAENRSGRRSRVTLSACARRHLRIFS